METFIVTTSECGEPHTEFYSGKSRESVMRFIILEERRVNYNTIHCSEIHMPETQTNALIVAILRARKANQTTPGGWGKFGDNSFKLEDDIDLGEFEPFFDKSPRYIVSNLLNSDVKLLFKYLFTGGYGDQSGNPGKEWTTISVKKFRLDKIQVTEPESDPEITYFDNTEYDFVAAKLKRLINHLYFTSEDHLMPDLMPTLVQLEDSIKPVQSGYMTRQKSNAHYSTISEFHVQIAKLKELAATMALPEVDFCSDEMCPKVFLPDDPMIDICDKCKKHVCKLHSNLIKVGFNKFKYACNLCFRK
jgi:hypothetical protein